ncbi:Pectate lyase superfamily protein [compost metagenome]
MPIQQVFRGLEANLPTLAVGQIGFTTDTKRVFVGSDAGNIECAKKEDVITLNERLADISAYNIMTPPPPLSKPKGDGTTLDTIIIQAVIDIAKAKSSSKVVIPAGWTFLVNQLNITGASNMVIEGGANLKLNFGINDSLFNLTNCKNVQIRDLNFTGVMDTDWHFNLGGAHRLIHVETSSFIKVENCSFEKFTSQAIYAKALNGGTYTEGIHIYKCIFTDTTYVETSAEQYCVYLDDDAEYSTVDSCQFYRVSHAVKCLNGANSKITNNIMMNTNASSSTLYVDRAIIYCEVLNNGGKITIANNTINHIDNISIPIIVKGLDAQPQLAYRIVDNNILQFGLSGYAYAMILFNAHNSIVERNFIRPNQTASLSFATIRVNDSNNVTVAKNFVDGGNVALWAANSIVKLSNNNFINQATKKVDFSAGGGIKVLDNRTFNFRMNSGLAGDEWDISTWTVTKIAVGHYQVTHDIGNFLFGVSCLADNSIVPLAFSVVRSNSNIDIYVADLAGTAVDAALLMMITINSNNPYSRIV